MLERATACLKAGVRDSLRCSRKTKAPRSKRTLHSTFWNHGAGDLELPPWAVSMYPMPSDLPLKGDNAPSQTAMCEASSKVNATPDGVFLDFLYPPQVLAYLQRISIPVWERWETRNARRLPEGFIQASRGCRSRSYAHSAAPAKKVSPEKSHLNNTPDRREDQSSASGDKKRRSGGHGEDEQEEASSARPTSDRSKAENDILMKYEPVSFDNSPADLADADYHHSPNPEDLETESSQEETAYDLDAFDDPPADFKHAGQDVPWSELESDARVLGLQNQLRFQVTHAPNAYFDSPADLAEGSIVGTPIRPSESLRAFLSKKNSLTPRDACERVWRLYVSLDDDERSNSRLMNELLDWLARLEDEVADAHCISLYWSIPLIARTLETYESAMQAFLRTGHLDSAKALHREAITNIPNGTSISPKLFRWALVKGKWFLALSTVTDHGNISNTVQDNLFWLRVSEMPDIVEHATTFTKATTALVNSRPERARHQPDGAQYQALSLRLSIEAIDAFLRVLAASTDPPLSDHTTPREKLRYLLHNILQNYGDANKRIAYVERIIVAMLQNPQYLRLHHVVGWLYFRYREVTSLTSISPPEELFVRLIGRLEEYAYLRRLEQTPKGVPLPLAVEDYKRHVGKMSQKTVHRLLVHYAALGDVRAHAEMYRYFEAQYPSYPEQKSELWTTIYVHARRANVSQARAAFAEAERKAKLNNDELDIQCWNVMLTAYSRADDVDGAFACLTQVLDQPGLTPDAYTFVPVIQLLARRGDIEGVEELLQQYDAVTQAKRTTGLLCGVLIALVNNDEMGPAVSLLRDLLPKVRATHEILGSLTTCFNVIITHYALSRDVDATKRTFAWMKEEGIRMDGDTYSALMLALTIYRKTSTADLVLRRVMREEGIEPTPFHYVLLMSGYLRQGEPHQALQIRSRMIGNGFRETMSSHRFRFIAEAQLKTKSQRPDFFPSFDQVPLHEVIAELRRAVVGDEALITPRKLRDATDADGIGIGKSAYVAAILDIYGRSKCLEAVKKLLEDSNQYEFENGHEAYIFHQRLLSAIMLASSHARVYDDVATYWNLAKEYAAKAIRLTSVPALRSGERPSDAASADESDAFQKALPNNTDHAEIGFQAGADKTTPYIPSVKLVPAAEASETPVTPDLALPRLDILAQPFLIYFRALLKQNRFADALRTLSQLNKDGYTLDSKTWNFLICTLCSSSPSLVLLAFMLTERFLIRNFPGWSVRGHRWPPKPQEKAEGSEHMAARYIPPKLLMPRYRTLVRLGAALLQLRQMEATGEVQRYAKNPVARYIGSSRLVREKAPKTLAAVRSMPSIDDFLQNRLLRPET